VRLDVVSCVPCLEREWELTVLRLARGAMAQLAVERLAAAELVLDLSAVAVGLVLGVKVLLLVVDAVRRALFPLGDAGR
jgi:hypothetical protein